MRLYRAVADSELAGDVGRGPARDDQVEDLALPASEPAERRIRPPVAAAQP